MIFDLKWIICNKKLYQKSLFVGIHKTHSIVKSWFRYEFDIYKYFDEQVILTGSQIPIFDTRSDGRDNFLSALLVAGNYDIPEVCTMFGRKLFRGNRAVRTSCDPLQTFTSPNYPPIAIMATTMQVSFACVFYDAIGFWTLNDFIIHRIKDKKCL